MQPRQLLLMCWQHSWLSSATPHPPLSLPNDRNPALPPSPPLPPPLAPTGGPGRVGMPLLLPSPNSQMQPRQLLLMCWQH
jgi:hypothetical protein